MEPPEPFDPPERLGRSARSGPPELLDPRNPAPRARAGLAAWLAFQRELAWRPREAARRLALGRPPAAAREAEWGGAIARLAELGVVGVPLPSPRYPERLRGLADPAPLLWVRGDPGVLGGRCVAIVGPRAPTSYGRGVARALARVLAGAGLVVVSGLARGVDAEAHEGALEAGGRTLAFQACGPDRVYPAAHRRLAARIAEQGGALASELPPGTPPRPEHFPLRNRLISGISLAVVAVEARERSGTLVTARHAAEQGVELLAVPGPIDAPTSRGTNRLLRDGAIVIAEVADALALVGLRAAPERDLSGASPGERAVWKALANGAHDVDTLTAAVDLPLRETLAALTALELAGAVECTAAGEIRRR